MTVVDRDAVRNWLGQLPDSTLVKKYVDQWDQFAGRPLPVVTIFGSYDAGKTSLLRRLLIDAGDPVPGWLTISARHETFEVNEVQLGGCIVRDTPGFTADPTDMRAHSNSGRALDAVGLTDIGIVVLTPQLVTAEREVFQKLIAQQWPADALWFVISRFDEAGLNPEYNLQDYLGLAQSKIAELKAALDLDPELPVFVVSQDPFQTAGPDLDLEPDTWDQFRSWDGMAGLAHALSEIGVATLPALREAAAQRYWSAVASEVIAELHGQLAEYSVQADVAANGVARRDGWKAELDVLDRTARAKLVGVVNDVLPSSGGIAAHAAEDVKTDLQKALENWLGEQNSRLQRLSRSISKAQDRERERPSWASFASLIKMLEADVEAPEDPDGSGGASRHLKTAGGMFISVLKAVHNQSEPSSGGKGLGQTIRKHLDAGAIDIAESALPLVVYLAGFYDDKAAASANKAREEAVAEARRRVVAGCIESAGGTWGHYVDDVRDLIHEQTHEQVELAESLRELVGQLRQSLSEGERILS